MITYKTKMVEQEILDGFICDKCGNEIKDDMELQETCSIRFVGGYASVFGDMNHVECDLCQNCLKDLIGDFCTYNPED